MNTKLDKKTIVIILACFVISISLLGVQLIDKELIEEVEGVGIVYLTSSEDHHIQEMISRNNIVVVPSDLSIQGNSNNLEFFPALRGEIQFLTQLNKELLMKDSKE